MIAREISIGGCLFVLFLVGLFVILNNPLKNILGKIFGGNDKIVIVVEMLFIFITARILTQWTEPGVTKWLEDFIKYVADIIFVFFAH